MKKLKELNDPASCLNKAGDDELIFVLLERDPAAADTVKFWAQRRIDLGINTKEDDKIQEALTWADSIARVNTRFLCLSDFEEHKAGSVSASGFLNDSFLIVKTYLYAGSEWILFSGFDKCFIPDHWEISILGVNGKEYPALTAGERPFIWSSNKWVNRVGVRNGVAMNVGFKVLSTEFSNAP